MIKDSGERRVFESGAVRDIQEGAGKGRCDLLPLGIVATLLDNKVLASIDYAIRQENAFLIMQAIENFAKQRNLSLPSLMLEVAIHFEEGSKKYGEHNWQKGIPTHCYLDSGIRHYLKWLRGDLDEPHDRAFVWNMLCLMWTAANKPEYDDVFKREDDE